MQKKRSGWSVHYFNPGLYFHFLPGRWFLLCFLQCCFNGRTQIGKRRLTGKWFIIDKECGKFFHPAIYTFFQVILYLPAKCTIDQFVEEFLIVNACFFRM